MNCPKCGTPAGKNGKTADGKQKYRCRACKHYFERPKEELIELSSEPAEQAVGLTEAQMRAKYDIRFIVATKCKELKLGVYLTRAEVPGSFIPATENLTGSTSTLHESSLSRNRCNY